MQAKWEIEQKNYPNYDYPARRGRKAVPLRTPLYYITFSKYKNRKVYFCYAYYDKQEAERVKTKLETDYKTQPIEQNILMFDYNFKYYYTNCVPVWRSDVT